MENAKYYKRIGSEEDLRDRIEEVFSVVEKRPGIYETFMRCNPQAWEVIEEAIRAEVKDKK